MTTSGDLQRDRAKRLLGTVISYAGTPTRGSAKFVLDPNIDRGH
jgi:hypothetical protein